MTSISAHEDKGRVINVGGCPGKGTQMANGMSRCVQEIERPVPEVVIGVEAADLQAIRFERNLSDDSTLCITVSHDGVMALWPTRPRSCADTGSDDEIGT